MNSREVQKQLQRATQIPKSIQKHEQKESVVGKFGRQPKSPQSVLHVFKYSIGQAIARVALLPFDVLKCKVQANPSYYAGLFKGLGTLRRERQLFIGLSPSVLRYFMFPFMSGQGIQFGLLKNQLYAIFSPVVISALLFPLQSIKIRMQLSAPQDQYPRSMMQAYKKIYHQQGSMKFYKSYMKFFQGFRLMLARDLIYYSLISTTYFNSFNLMQSLLVISGALVISHPFDTLLTTFYSKKVDKHPNIVLAEIYKELGFKGLFRGFLERTIVLGGGLLAGFGSMYAIMLLEL